MTFAATDDQILDLDGVAQRFDQYRFDLHALSGEKLGELDPDVGQPPVVTCDTSARLGRTLTSLHLPASDVTHIDPLSMSVRPYMVLQNGSQYPLGVYRWADLNEDRQPWGTERASSLVDQTVILDQQMTGAFSRGVGVNVILAARRLAEQVIPTEQIDMVSNPAAISPWAGVTYGPGDNRLRSINELLEGGGCVPAFFDETGRLQLRPPPLPTSNLDVDYFTGGPTRVVAGSEKRWTNIIDVPNLFIVWSSSGSGPNYRSVIRVPASAPHSRANRGYDVPVVHGGGNLGSNAHAGVIAYWLFAREGSAYEFLQFQSTPDPRHKTWSLIRFIDGSIWLELGWKLICAAGRPGGIMEHRCRRLYEPETDEDT